MSLIAAGFLGWGISLAAPAMLWGLGALAIPVIIHFLNRRRGSIEDWGAMQFLGLGRRAQRRFQLTELLLMLGRMALIAMVVLALVRPMVAPSQALEAGSAANAFERSGGAQGEPRDTVVVLDGSESMGLLAAGSSPRERAIDWARAYVNGLPGSSLVTLIDARDRVRVLGGAALIRDRAIAELATLAPPRGASDLAAAITAGLEALAQGRHAAREMVVLTDGQQFAWRADEAARWALMKDVYRSTYHDTPFAPRILGVEFRAQAAADQADGRVGPLRASRPYIPAHATITIRCSVNNAGPGPLDRDVDLLVDGGAVAQLRQHIGPIPPGGSAPLEFGVALERPGPHVVSVRLGTGDDPLDANDQSDLPLEVVEGLPVLVVDGGAGDRGSDSRFLRAALSPSGDPSPSVLAQVIGARQFDKQSARGARVIALVNVSRLSGDQQTIVKETLASGGGLLVVPGPRTDASFYDGVLFESLGWLPARFKEWVRVDANAPTGIAHPLAVSFGGAVMGTFADNGEGRLSGAKLFSRWTLEPRTEAAVTARLDTGETWVVEGAALGGKVAMLAGALDEDSGTLLVNADFVPWLHALVFHLAGASDQALTLSPGTTASIALDDARVPIGVDSIEVRLPDGRRSSVGVSRNGGRPSVRLTDTSEGGVYRLMLPNELSPIANLLVASDVREREDAVRTDSDSEMLTGDWPMLIETDGARALQRVGAAARSAPRAAWRWLLLAALGGLCLEVVATRRLARARGLSEHES